jgi:hypothetical protein
MHDLHATMLYMLGLDHEKLTYKYAGRDFRLTDVYGNVVRDILAESQLQAWDQRWQSENGPSRLQCGAM